jgi:hypothetical protein
MFFANMQNSLLAGSFTVVHRLCEQLNLTTMVR